MYDYKQIHDWYLAIAIKPRVYYVDILTPNFWGLINTLIWVSGQIIWARFQILFKKIEKGLLKGFFSS